MGSVGYLLVTGSRNTPAWLKAVIRTRLREIIDAKRLSSGGAVDEFEIIVGEATGVDAEAVAWVQEQLDPRVRLHVGSPFVADWEAACEERCVPGHRRTRPDGSDFCPAAGPYRNGRMVALAQQYQAAGSWVEVAAFYADPQSKGTANCVQQAEAAGLHVRKFGNAPEDSAERKALLGLWP